MKKFISFFLILLIFFSCKKNNFVTFSGKIKNKNSDSVVISNPQKQFQKIIKINDNGTFKDTLKIDKGLFSLSDGKKHAVVYFRNGDEISMNVDAKEFNKSLVFAGKGAGESNFLSVTARHQVTFTASIPQLLELPEERFSKDLNTYVSDFKLRLRNKDLDTDFVTAQNKNIKRLESQLIRLHKNKMYLRTQLPRGMPSPKFVEYETPEKEIVSLDDLKGKYVYIDIWATWCKPCTAEIPFLRKIEEKYHNENIEFVSISIDKRDDYFTWLDMVEEKNPGGIQLYANEDEKFTTAYMVNDIPRFILIDPDGNIVDADAPEPSNPELVELFTELEI